MTRDRWLQVQRLFRLSLHREPEERLAYLHQVCDDADVRADVIALLDEDRAPRTLFRTAGLRLPQRSLATAMTRTEGAPALPARTTRPRDPYPILDRTPRQIGPYRLVRELGRGGMGTVYLAERDDIDKQVALKLVRSPLAAPDTDRRFLRERRILARLEHPNIARLLDAGVTPDDTPYFVMEYVEGESLTAYCDRRHLGITDRLVLFLSVCEAVRYAHQNLVIHRDLKPSNILVSDAAAGATAPAPPGRPVVKLLDFGIAKLIEDDDPDGLTRTGMRLMTPRYAAPEQVRGEPVTTATDVYALGLLLYELLTGHRPYDVPGQSPAEMERVICGVEPPRPSTMVDRNATFTDEGVTRHVSPKAVSTARATPTERLRRLLHGDLDTICLKALQKEPGRRYPSADAFLDDIKRHLAGLPVEARPNTLGYRIRKFSRRHRGGVAASLIAALTLATLVTAFTLRLAHERDRAVQSARTAQQASAFLSSLFGAADPYANERADTLSARTLLRHGTDRLEREMADQPELQTDLLNEIAHVYTNLGLYDEAETLLRRTLAAGRNRLGDGHPVVAETMELLGRALFEQGDDAHAEPLLRQALSVQQRLPADEDLHVTKTMNSLAELLRSRRDFAGAEALYREALDLRRKHLGAAHPGVAENLNNLGNVLRDQDDLEAAERSYRDALALHRQLSDADHPDIATTLSNLAGVRRARGAFEEAEALYREALAIEQALLNGHPKTAVTLNNLAMVRRDQGALNEAEALHREALDLVRSTLGPDHPYVAHFTGNLARDVYLQGRTAEAEALYRRSATLYRRQGNSYALARTLNHLASVLDERNVHAEAEPLYREALALFADILPPADPNVAVLKNNLAECLTALNRLDEAETLFMESHPLLEAAFGPDADATRTSRARIAALYDRWDRPDRAAAWRNTTDAPSS